MNLKMIFGILLVLLAAQYLMRYIFNYRVSSKYIKVVLFWVIPVFFLRKVRKVEKITYIETWFKTLTLHWFNKIIADYCVLIEWDGFYPFNAIIISPEDPDKFIKNLNIKISDFLKKY